MRLGELAVFGIDFLVGIYFFFKVIFVSIFFVGDREGVLMMVLFFFLDLYIS